MSAVTVTARSSKVHDRILDAAQELFYRQGYQATVVNQIIDAAGISKPTFYAHFASKEDLCVAYLRRKRAFDLQAFRTAIAQHADPMERFLAPMRLLKERMAASDFRGCGFFNIMTEVTDMNSPIVHEVRTFNGEFRDLLRDVTKEMLDSRPGKTKADVDHFTDAYGLLFAGALMLSQETRDLAPIDLAVRQVRQLVA
jgi:AcrR family transcriptional regulator